MAENRGAFSLTRRSFLKTSAAVAGAAGVAGALPSLGRAHADEAPGEEQVLTNVCRVGCTTGCALQVHVRDEKVVKVEPAPTPDDVYRRCCLRGMSHVQTMYSPDRLLYPMKRVERGKDDWERISWDQAIDEISAKWQEVIDTVGPLGNAVFYNGGHIAELNGSLGGLPRFFNAMGMQPISNCVDYGFMVGLNRVYGETGAYGNTAEPKDLENAYTYFSWGCNLTTAWWDRWNHVKRGVDKGAKLVVIDPTFTTIASKADHYYSIRPASDVALVLAMLNIGFAEKRFDYDFAKRATVAPYLVREDNGMFLRMSDLGVEPVEGPANPMTGQPTMIDPAAVMDSTTKKPAADGTVKNPAITGSFTVKGVKVRCALDLLEEHVAEYTPEWASELTGLTADEIHEIADLFFDGGTVANLMGFGANAYYNGPAYGHAFATLIVLTGNIGKPGTSATLNNNFILSFNALWMYPDMQGVLTSAFPVLDLPELVEKGQIVYGDEETAGGSTGLNLFGSASGYAVYNAPKTLLITQANAYANFLNPQAWDEMLPKIDMVVVIDRVFNDTARYLADYVLPAAHYFETEDYRPMLSGSPYAVYGDKVAEPQGESKPDWEIYKLFAAKFGISQHFEGEPDEIMAQTFLGDFEQLKRDKVVRIQEEGVQPYSIDQGTIPTASGKFEFYSEIPMTRLNSPVPPELVEENRLPTFMAPLGIWETQEAGEYPFILMATKVRGLLHTQYYQVQWLREIFPGPVVYMNEEDAADRALANGDWVRVYNEQGEAVVQLVATPGQRKGTLMWQTGWPNEAYKKGNFHTMTPIAYNPVSVNHSFNEICVNIEKWEG